VPADSDQGEKTEDPTPRKIQQAREEGQVAYSAELGTGILLFAGLGLLLACTAPLTAAVANMTRWCLNEGLDTPVDSLSAVWDILPVFGPTAWWTLAICGGCTLVVLIVAVVQVGPLLTLKPLIPKANRLSPLQGAKRIFGTRGWVRFGLSLLKLGVIGVTAVILVVGLLENGIPYTMTVIATAKESADNIAFLAAKLVAGLLVLAILDVLYQRWQHQRDLMMSKHEVKQEMKQSDGDPLLKSRMRQIQREMAQNRMMEAVPKADVVITNPTHVAVALQYDADSMHAPVCVAKGYDAIAQRIKGIAAENDIEMIENVPLARALAKAVKVGQAIPIEHYQAVAEILAALYQTKQPQPIA
jgi:flagellar biosynthetic protein FlhB